MSDGADPSAESGYADHAEDRIWRIGGVSNAVLARRVRSVRLDVLIDLNGYSRQARLPLFLYRAALRQVAWFNSYATSGMSAFDALVGDASVVTPEEEAALLREHRPGARQLSGVRGALSGAGCRTAADPDAMDGSPSAPSPRRTRSPTRW